MLSLGAAVIAAVALGATLSVDALSVAMSIGARMHGKLSYRNYSVSIFWFTAVHVAMLSVGFLLGDALAGIINGVGPWVSFTLLGLVGGIMIRSALKGEVEEDNLMFIPPLTWKTLVPLAFACSIDAVAVGSSLGLSRNIPFSVTIVCVALATIIAVACGLYAGNKAGEKWEKPAEIAGGIVLVFIGLKSFI